jgi:hypothetical protein
MLDIVKRSSYIAIGALGVYIAYKVVLELWCIAYGIIY